MSERFQIDLPDFRAPNPLGQFQPLPGWLADRLLRPNEKVVWVRGPWFNPSWERYVTHPGLFFIALALGAGCVGVGVKIAQGDFGIVILSIVLAGCLIIPTILVLGISCGYFTRLVVTNFRLVIVQGYEVCRSWGIDDLPYSMIRYRAGGDDRMPSIDLDAVQRLLGGSSDKFTNAKSILSFGKQLDRIKKERD